jgi:prepilin-type N-terminal cleavage/methylation domain-containing protein
MRSSRGFTLLELVLVVALFASLAGLFSMNAMGARDQAKLDTSVRELQSFLREAQTLGRTGRAYGLETDPDRYDKGYGVYLKDDDTKAVLYGGAGTDDATANDNRHNVANEVRTLVLQPGVTISEVLVDGTLQSEAHVHFRRGLLGANIHVDSPDDHYDVATTTLSIGSFKKSVVVNKVGLIYVQ